MSNPQNILGKFKSYAYHHILMVCNTTEAAEELTNTSEITTFQHPSENVRYAPRQIGRNPNSKYITLIDGTTDARFYITTASWENIIAMENYVGANDTPQSTSMSLEGELEIIEPLGAKFLNRLTDVCDALESDPIGLVFVLKTIFVGHNDDGTTEMISNIKPLLFIVYDISSIFDSSGAKYKMLFVGAVNGLGKLPHTQKIANGLSFTVNKGDTLAKTFDGLAEQLNASYDGYEEQAIKEFAISLYEEATKEGNSLTPAQAEVNAKQFFKNNYRGVTYKIIAPDYDDARYVAGDNESVRIANKREVGSFNFGKNVGIEDIIKKLMASSTGVIKDGVEGSEGKKYIYKIVSGLQSAHDNFVVEYYVNRYELAQLPYDAAFNGEEFKPKDGQSVEFNYIFTGKNIDIKNFDIKMEMGMSFFQIAATTDTLPSQQNNAGEKTSSVQRTTGANYIASKGKKQRPKTPLFLGSKIKQAIARNTKNPGDSASFQALLNRHAALENIEATMLIFGNPQLLSEMQVVPSDLINRQTEKPAKHKTINPRWIDTPTLVKVNIKMPSDSNDVNTEYEDFWYTGYYTLFAVKQIFDGGEFLQELDMMSIPVADKITTKVDAKEDDKSTWQGLKDSTYDIYENLTSNTDGDKVTVGQQKSQRANRGKRGK